MSERRESADRDRLTELVDQKCNGALGKDGHAELYAMLKRSEELRRAYWKMVGFHVDLHWLLADKKSSSERSERLLTSESMGCKSETSMRRIRTGHAPWRQWATLALAASLMIAAGLTAIVWTRGGRQQEPRIAESALESKQGTHRNQPSEQLADEIPADAQIASLAKNSSWRTGRPGERNPGSLRYGDTVWADEGVIELRLNDGAVGVLRAPVVLQLLASDRVRLLSGHITVTAPKLTNGFTVETPTAEVVDLGTVFSVASAKEGTDLVIFGGKVDLRIPHGGSGEEPLSQDSMQLVTGEAVHVSQEGTVSRVMSVQSSGDPMDPSDASRFAVIRSVADNNVRRDNWSFYQIVVGGMQEDAPAYVDRFHEWNGVTPEGMPSYLVGGDYIKVFNEDKAEEDLRIEVTLAQPAALYILLDKRVATPDWLANSFTDTGDVVGVDESPHDTANRFPANDEFAQVGAGESIDRVHSVWKKIVPKGGTVALGTNGMLPNREGQDPRPHYIRANMYGVVAVPLEHELQTGPSPLEP